MDVNEEFEYELSEESKDITVINSLDLLIGFTEARKRAEEKKAVVFDEGPQPTYLQHCVFLSNVDSFNGKTISSLLSKEVYSKISNDPEKVAEEEAPPAVESAEKIIVQTPPAKPVTFQIIGTVTNNRLKSLDNVNEIIQFKQDEEFIDKLLDCGYIIYDITTDVNQVQEADWVLQCIEQKIRKKQEDKNNTTDKLDEMHLFILLSTVMTWAKTKPIDPEDPDVPFTDTDYRKRRAHPNYKTHIDLEKKTVRVGKMFDKFKTMVICSGIVYGKEECDLHPLFKLAWLGEPMMPICLPGNNEIPLIHVLDLTKVIIEVIQNMPAKYYILAIEQTPTTLKQIVRGLSKTMGTGKTKMVSKEETFLYDEITQDIYDKLTVNLKIEAAYVLNDLPIQWTTDMSFAENIHAICTEYKQARGLRPIKIFLHGPPASGKTRLADRLCTHYKLHYISVKECIREKVDYFNKMIESIKEMEEIKTQQEETEMSEDTDDASQEETATFYQDKLEEINVALAESPNGKLDDELVIQLLREKLLSNECQCQGYVLDNYPKTIARANELFAKGDDEEIEGEEEEDDSADNYSKKLIPEFAVSLTADDNFLCDRVMYLPEKDVQGTRYAEEEMIRRLILFRESNTEDNSVLVYFDEIEIHPIILSVIENDDDDMSKVFAILEEIIGKPRNFGLSKKEAEEKARREKNERRESAMRKQIEHEVREIQMRIEREAKMEEWANLMMELRKEEDEILAIQSEPLRHYLMKFVFPTLTKGLIEVARLRPDDPIDFLAEYMFKENPEGHMFDPAYTEAADKLHKVISQIQDVLNELQTDNDENDNEDKKDIEQS